MVGVFSKCYSILYNLDPISLNNGKIYYLKAIIESYSLPTSLELIIS